MYDYDVYYHLNTSILVINQDKVDSEEVLHIELVDDATFDTAEIKSFVDFGNHKEFPNNLGDDINIVPLLVADVEDVMIEVAPRPETIFTVKPLINNFINIGPNSNIETNHASNENLVLASIQPFTATTQPPPPSTTTTTTTPTPSALLSTESFFMEHSKVQEIPVEDFVTENKEIPVKDFFTENMGESEIDSFTKFNNQNFHNFMNNFGSQIQKIFFSNESHIGEPEEHNDKYFSLFQDFQEFKTQWATTPVPRPLPHLYQHPSTTGPPPPPTTTTTTTTRRIPTYVTTPQVNLLQSIIR